MVGRQGLTGHASGLLRRNCSNSAPSSSALGNSDASVAAVSYVWHLYHPLRGEMLVWQVEAFRVLFFLLVGVAALRAAAALAEWRAASNFHDGRGARHVAGVSGSEAIDPDLDASGRTLRVSRTLTGEV